MFNHDVTLCGWLGSKYQPTTCVHSVVETSVSHRILRLCPLAFIFFPSVSVTVCETYASAFTFWRSSAFWPLLRHVWADLTTCALQMFSVHLEITLNYIAVWNHCSPFTRVQRLTCALCLLLNMMLASLMFNQMPSDNPAEQVGPCHCCKVIRNVRLPCWVALFVTRIIIIMKI